MLKWMKNTTPEPNEENIAAKEPSSAAGGVPKAVPNPPAEPEEIPSAAETTPPAEEMTLEHVPLPIHPEQTEMEQSARVFQT